MKVLIIEDNRDIVDAISLAFQIRWPEVTVVSTHLGKKGSEMVETESPDLVILDLGLPDSNGFDILREIRLFSDVPIIILTVKSDEQDIVRGLERGADDYIVKPFRQLELLARTKALIRRQNPTEEKVVSYGVLNLDMVTGQLQYGKRQIALTQTENRILTHLIKSASHVATHASLAEAVWGSDYPGSADSLKVHIRRLREKIERDPSNPELILTKMSVGYFLAKLK